MNIHEPVQGMTIGYFLKHLPMGLLMWIPMLIFAFVMPVIGWLLIPVALVWPIAYPFVNKSKERKAWKKARQEAIENATFEKLIPQT